MNCSLNIIELKVNKVKQSTMDSVYQNCYFGRLNQIDSYLKITEDYKTFVLSDKATNNWKTKFQNADPTKKGHLVWYYIKAIFINRNKEQTNILRQYSFSCFDDNNNLLITDIDFADWEFAKQ